MGQIKNKDLVSLDSAEEKSDEHRTFYTLEEVANMLKVPTRAIKRFISTRKLKAIKIGHRSLRVEKSEYETFLDQFYN